MIRAGSMRHRLRFESRSATLDSAGQQLLAWTLFAERAASIERQRGREAFAAGQRQGRVPTTFRLRYLAGVGPAMRLVFDGRVYDIESAVDPDGLRAELLVTAVEHLDVTP